VTYTVAGEGGITKLTVLHDRLDNASQRSGVAQGWPRILSALKTWIETGAPMQG
jgi:hypothetical protein